MADIKKATAAAVSQIAKSANEIELDLWRLRAELGVPPSARERAFVEFLKTQPEFLDALEEQKALVRRARAGHGPRYSLYD